jgi:outer membrane receptor for monomeric catechols
LFGGYELYASTAASFHPINTVPANGVPLSPERSGSYDVGQKWQSLHRRITVNAALRRIINYNIPISLGGGVYDEAGKADSNVADIDIEGDLGHGFRVVGAYGYALPRYDSYTTSGGRKRSGKTVGVCSAPYLQGLAYEDLAARRSHLPDFERGYAFYGG